MSNISRRTVLRGAAALGAAGLVPHSARRAAFPDTINLPDGFRPEGITIGAPYAYFGSLADGAIYRANLATGAGEIISAGPGTPSVGLKLDRRGRLFVSGGASGGVRVVSVSTGEELASFQFASGTTFINDVVLTDDAAWFTDSANPVPALYRVPLRGGATSSLPLQGDLVFSDPGPNANGIVRTPDGRGLIIVQTATGLLFRVDPVTGVTRTVDLGGESVPNGDGLLLRGRTLYVVQNRLNTVAVFTLNRSGTRARFVERVTDPRFDVPTTIAAFGDRLYLPNARFTTPPEPTTTYTAVAIRP